MEKLLITLVKGLVGGRALKAEEMKTLEWLDGWEKSTVQNVLDLLQATHEAGYERGKMAGFIEGQKPHCPKCKGEESSHSVENVSVGDGTDLWKCHECSTVFKKDQK